MKSLIVGDIHGKPGDLTDCRRLAEFILDSVEEHKPDQVLFLGDQYDTHGIVHVAVQKFWMDLFGNLGDRLGIDQVIAMVGNHDMLGDRSIEAHAMQVHARDVSVVDWFLEREGVCYSSYVGDIKPISRCLEVGEFASEDVLVCHETFVGATYDNGFFAKDGIDPDKLPFKRIISGHIHTPLAFGKVWYPGSPRYLTVSDANIPRAIYIVDLQDLDATPKVLSTDKVVSKIWSFKDSPETANETEEGLAQVKTIDRVVVDITGPASFVEERKKKLARAGVRIRTFPTDGRVSSVKESDGIDVAFKKYCKLYEPKYGTESSRLTTLAKERLGV